MSLGANFLASSTTWVDSALLGSHEEASFCWALFSLPASGPATATTTTQNPRTTHLVRRPLGRLTIRRTPLMTPPSRHRPHRGPPSTVPLSRSTYIRSRLFRPSDSRRP